MIVSPCADMLGLCLSLSESLSVALRRSSSMANPLWFVELLKQIYPYKRIIAKMTRIPGVGKIFYDLMFKEDGVIYLPKDNVVKMSIHVGKSIERPTDTILPSKIVKHFIEKARHRWIMNKCICRDSDQCKDYPIDLGCLFLGEAVLGINPQLGREVTKEEAFEHLRKCQDAGLVQMIGRNKLDTMWLNIGPGSKLLTICNCCPCCCLWNALPEFNPLIARKIARMEGVSVCVTDGCTGCGICTDDVCFVDAITLVSGRAVISDECRGCGRCVEVCPEGAIELTIESDVIYEETIERIASLVDVE